MKPCTMASAYLVPPTMQLDCIHILCGSSEGMAEGPGLQCCELALQEHLALSISAQDKNPNLCP